MFLSFCLFSTLPLLFPFPYFHSYAVYLLTTKVGSTQVLLPLICNFIHLLCRIQCTFYVNFTTGSVVDPDPIGSEIFSRFRIRNSFRILAAPDPWWIWSQDRNTRVKFMLRNIWKNSFRIRNQLKIRIRINNTEFHDILPSLPMWRWLLGTWTRRDGKWWMKSVRLAATTAPSLLATAAQQQQLQPPSPSMWCHIATPIPEPGKGLSKNRLFLSFEILRF